MKHHRRDGGLPNDQGCQIFKRKKRKTSKKKRKKAENDTLKNGKKSEKGYHPTNFHG